MPSIVDPVFDGPRTHPGFECLRARLGRQAGSRRVGLSLWKVEPGKAAYPYHGHLAEEEVVVVLSGHPSLRTPSGWRELEPGAVVAFDVGAGGAHQIVNRGEETVRFLAISNQQPDVVFYPDSDKAGAFERRPDGGGYSALFRTGDDVDYFEGEEAP